MQKVGAVVTRPAGAVHCTQYTYTVQCAFVMGFRRLSISTNYSCITKLRRNNLIQI